MRVVTEEEANFNHLCQTLSGDRTDNYSGIPGCGPITAEKILKGNETWAAVSDAYKRAGLTEEDALANARCARICRDGDYTPKTGQVRLWKPTI